MLGLIGESGRRQVDHRPRRHGLCPRPAAASPAARSCFDGSDLLTPRAAEPPRSSAAARIAYVAQSAAAAFNPAHRLIDQVVEAAVQPRPDDRRPRPSRRAGALSASSACPIPNASASAIPHQVSGGQLQRAMTAMAMSCRARPHRLRRADHGARRHHPDRGAGRDQGRASASTAPRRSTSPTTSPSSPRSPTASWCCATAMVEEGPTPPDPRTTPREDYTQRAGRRARACEHAEAEQARASRRCSQVQRRRRRLRRRCVKVLDGRHPRRPRGPDGRGGRRIRLRQVDARPRHHRPAAADRRARSASTASRCRRASSDAQQGPAAPHPDDLPDAGHRAEPAPDACATSSAGRSSFYFGLTRPASRDAADRRAARHDRARATASLDRLPGRALGRPEAARLHRPRARRRARPDHLRRGHLRARPARRRGHPEAPAAAAGRARRRLSLHHPRPRHGEAIADEIVVM